MLYPCEFLHIPPYNTPPIISINISRTSNLPDIYNFVHKYFLSSAITFLFSFHTLIYFMPPRVTIATSFPPLHYPAFFPLSFFFSIDRLSLQCPVRGSVLSLQFYWFYVFVLVFFIRFTSPNHCHFFPTLCHILPCLIPSHFTIFWMFYFTSTSFPPLHLSKFQLYHFCPLSPFFIRLSVWHSLSTMTLPWCRVVSLQFFSSQCSYFMSQSPFISITTSRSLNFSPTNFSLYDSPSVDSYRLSQIPIPGPYCSILFLLFGPGDPPGGARVLSSHSLPSNLLPHGLSMKTRVKECTVQWEYYWKLVLKNVKSFIYKFHRWQR